MIFTRHTVGERRTLEVERVKTAMGTKQTTLENYNFIESTQVS